MQTTNASATTNGVALAAFLAGGIGTFAMGLIVILSEMGLFRLPAFYAPAGGVSTRTTVAVVVWLVAWAVLHAKWKTRDVAIKPVFAATLALIAFGILFAFPPVWGLL